jgi:hypothetical protein
MAYTDPARARKEWPTDTEIHDAVLIDCSMPDEDAAPIEPTA